MGQAKSSERSMYKKILCNLLLKKGIQFERQQLSDFLRFVRSVSPWFPDKGTLDEAAWKRVGKDMRTWIPEHKHEEDEGQVPESAVMFWFVIKQALTHAEITDLPSSSASSVCSIEHVMEESIPLLSK